jgi:Na+-transporting methylmalonyl-CoA/oxaloacetate decarboxylase gamma subunit
MKSRYLIASAFSVAVLGMAVWLAWILEGIWGSGFIPAILWLVFVVVMFLPVIFLVAANPGKFKTIFFPSQGPELSEAEIQQRNDRKEKVIARIRESFRGVTLCNGVGLHEGEKLDYSDRSMLKTTREKDEKDDWERISVANLNDCTDAMAFFDAEGMRFHLPAYLIADLRGALTRDIDFFLPDLDDDKKSKLDTLSKEQRAAVREYLLCTRDMIWNESLRLKIDKALADYWDVDEDKLQC